MDRSMLQNTMSKAPRRPGAERPPKAPADVLPAAQPQQYFQYFVPGIVPGFVPGFAPAPPATAPGIAATGAALNQNELNLPSDWLHQFACMCKENLLQQGRNVTYYQVVELMRSSVEFIQQQFGQFSGIDYRNQVPILNGELRLEQALTQFLLAYRATHTVYALTDIEQGFMESRVGKSFHVTQWESLKVGPFVSHPLVRQIFPEFPQAVVNQISALEMLEQITQYRIDNQMAKVEPKSFREWYKTVRGCTPEDEGAHFIEGRLPLIMGCLNAAFAQRRELHKKAVERCLAKLSHLSESEVDEEQKRFVEGSTSLEQQLTAAVGGRQEPCCLKRLRNLVSQSGNITDAYVVLCVWARYFLEEEPKPFVVQLIGSLVTLLWRGSSSAAFAPQTLSSSRKSSPQEVEASVQLAIQALPQDQTVDIAVLAKLEETITQDDAGFESLLPGSGGFLKFIADSPRLAKHLNGLLNKGVETVANSQYHLGQDVTAVVLSALEGLPRSQGPVLLDLQAIVKLELQVLRLLGKSEAPSKDWAGRRSFVHLLVSLISKLEEAQQDHRYCSQTKDYKPMQLFLGQLSMLNSSREVALHFGVNALPCCESDKISHGFGALDFPGLHSEAAVIALVDAAAGETNHMEPAGEISELNEEFGHWAKGQGEVGIFGKRDRDCAFKSLAALPFLVDVQTSLCWAEVFEASLGSLHEFLKTEAKRGELEERKLCFICVSPGSLSAAGLAASVVRIPPNSDSLPEQLNEAVANGDAYLAAAVLCSLYVADPNISALNTLTRGVRKIPLNERISFLTSMLVHMPERSASKCGRDVVLPLLQEVQDWQKTAWDVGASLGIQATRRLGLLGAHWTIHEWVSSFRQVILEGLAHELHSQEKWGLLQAGLLQRKEGMILSNGVGNLAQSEMECKDCYDVPKNVPLSKDLTYPESSMSIGNELRPIPDCFIGNDELSHERQVIKGLKEGFLLEQKTASQLQRNLGGSLNRLADDLYNDKHHFIFELIQNFDDNKYWPGTTPEMTLVLNGDELIALNNECGFREKDVVALCSVSDSTKTAKNAEDGYKGPERIGKKGIGFKSNFMISDNPTIHSVNADETDSFSEGWHFSFDATLNQKLKIEGVDVKGLGYIVPSWVCPSDKRNPTWSTEIRLPFKPSFEEHHRNALRNDLNSLDGVVLCNLQQLQAITIEDRVLKPAGKKQMYKELLNEHVLQNGKRNVIRIHTQNSSRELSHSFQDYFVIAKKFPFAGSKGQVQQNVQLTIAFPLPSATFSTITEWRNEPLKPMETYCFLPLRHFGWNVIIHANWDVTASRDQIHVSDWNDQIKRHIPEMIVCAVHEAKELLMMPPESQALSTSSRDPLQHTAVDVPDQASVRRVPYDFIFRFLPLLGDLGRGNTDYFRGTEQKIWLRLQKERCVFNTFGEWVLPTKTLIAPPSMQRVIPAALLLKHRGLHYLHPECSPPSGTAKLLKIHLQDDCFEILCDIWQKMLEGEDGIHLVQSHNFGWLAEVMVLLSELVYASGTTEDHSSKFNTLRALPLVPLDGSSEKVLMPIKDGVIFQPQGEFDSALLNFLGIRQVDPQVYTANEELGPRLRRFFEQLGVQKLKKADVIVYGILPLFQPKDLEPDSVVFAVRFLAENTSEFDHCKLLLGPQFSGQSFLQVLKATLRLPCRVASQCPTETTFQSPADSAPLVFSSRYHQALTEVFGNSPKRQAAHEILADLDMVKLFSDVENEPGMPTNDFYLLSDMLIDGVTDPNVVERLTVFLRTLGCCFLVPVETLSQTISVVDLRSQGEHKGTPTKLLDEDMVTVNDTGSTALKNLLERVESDKERCGCLGLALAAAYALEEHENHEIMYASYVCGSEVWKTHSTLAFMLLSHKWVVGTSSRPPCTPGEIYLHSDEAALVLRDRAQLLKLPPGNKGTLAREFFQVLGVDELSARHVLSLLRDFRSEGRSEFSEAHISAIYLFLYNQSQQEASGSDERAVISMAFERNREPLIFVPYNRHKTKIQNVAKREKNIMTGYWITIDECCIRTFRWGCFGHPVDGQLSMTGSDIRELEQHYSKDMYEAFVCFGVKDKPTSLMLVQSIAYLVRSGDRDRALEWWQKVVHWLAKNLPDEDFDAFRRLLAKYPILLTEAGQWVAWRYSLEQIEDQLSTAVDVFLPAPQSKPAPQVIVVSRKLDRYFNFLAKLGMQKAIATSGTSVVDAGQASASTGGQTLPEVPFEQVPFEDLPPPIENSEEELHLRRAMAYVQIWLQSQHAQVHAYLEKRIRGAPAPIFYISKRLQNQNTGENLCAHFDHTQQVLYVLRVLDYMQKNAAATLKLPFAKLLGEALGLKSYRSTSSSVFSLAVSLSEEVIDRLLQAEKPGRAAQQVLRSWGVQCHDPSSLSMNWWLAEPPLPLEESEATEAQHKCTTSDYNPTTTSQVRIPEGQQTGEHTRTQAKLNKQLRQIEHLEKQHCEGKTLCPEEFAKISKKQALQQQLLELNGEMESAACGNDANGYNEIEQRHDQQLGISQDRGTSSSQVSEMKGIQPDFASQQLANTGAPAEINMAEMGQRGGDQAMWDLISVLHSISDIGTSSGSLQKTDSRSMDEALLLLDQVRCQLLQSKLCTGSNTAAAAGEDLGKRAGNEKQQYAKASDELGANSGSGLCVGMGSQAQDTGEEHDHEDAAREGERAASGSNGDGGAGESSSLFSIQVSKEDSAQQKKRLQEIWNLKKMRVGGKKLLPQQLSKLQRLEKEEAEFCAKHGWSPQNMKDHTVVQIDASAAAAFPDTGPANNAGTASDKFPSDRNSNEKSTDVESVDKGTSAQSWLEASNAPQWQDEVSVTGNTTSQAGNSLQAPPEWEAPIVRKKLTTLPSFDSFGLPGCRKPLRNEHEHRFTAAFGGLERQFTERSR